MKKRKRDLLIGLLIVVAAVLFKVVLTIANAHISTATVDITHLPIQSGHITIAINNEEYHPNIVVVTRGTTITWVNHDPMAHTVTQGQNAAPTPSGFNSNQMSSGQSWSYVFNKPGTYLYTCAYHVNMNARVIVH